MISRVDEGENERSAGLWRIRESMISKMSEDGKKLDKPMSDARSLVSMFPRGEMKGRESVSFIGQERGITFVSVHVKGWRDLSRVGVRTSIQGNGGLSRGTSIKGFHELHMSEDGKCSPF